jgi:outer membrane murein-binding lipoprotein Lpp
MSANKVTGANAGVPRQSAMRTPRAARIAQFYRCDFVYTTMVQLVSLQIMKIKAKEILIRLTTRAIDIPIVRFLLAVVVCLALTGCQNSRAPNTEAVSAQGVQLTSCKAQEGHATKAQLEQGLKAAAQGMSAAYAELQKTTPQLKGHLRGIVRIKPDGTVLSFTDIHSEFMPILSKQAFSDFIGAGFGPSCRFPSVGSALALQVDFELEPGS